MCEVREAAWSTPNNLWSRTGVTRPKGISHKLRDRKLAWPDLGICVASCQPEQVYVCENVMFRHQSTLTQVLQLLWSNVSCVITSYARVKHVSCLDVYYVLLPAPHVASHLWFLKKIVTLEFRRKLLFHFFLFFVKIVNTTLLHLKHNIWKYSVRNSF